MENFEQEFMRAAQEAEEHRREAARTLAAALAQRIARADALVSHVRKRFVWAGTTGVGDHADETGPGGPGTRAYLFFWPANTPERVMAIGADTEGRLWYIYGSISEKWNWKQTDALLATEEQLDHLLLQLMSSAELEGQPLAPPPEDLAKPALPPDPRRSEPT